MFAPDPLCANIAHILVNKEEAGLCKTWNIFYLTSKQAPCFKLFNHLSALPEHFLVEH